MYSEVVRKPNESKIVVLAAARNVERDLKKSINKIRQALSPFAKIRFVIVESYSSDDTKTRLKNLASKSSDIEYFSIGSKEDLKEVPRTVRIANARNFAKEYAENRFNDFEYVAVADLDNVNSALTSDGVESCWDYENWDAMFANQGLYYYDIWALKHELWNPEDCWQQYRKLTKEFSPKNSLQLAIKSKKLQIGKIDRPIKVQSAFGGFGIYQAKNYFNSRYIGINKINEEICEHLSFHSNLLSKELYINPKMINISRIHQRRGMLIGKLKQK